MKNGGLILWNFTAISFKISRLVGKLHTKGDLGNHLKDRLFHVVHWLSITLSLRKTSRDSINLVRKCYHEYSLDMHCIRANMERKYFGRKTLRNWERRTQWKSVLEGINAQEMITPKIRENFFFQSQMEQINCLEENMESRNPP